MSEIWPYVAGIVPTILVATLFYFLIKSMIEGDRRERLAQSRFEAEQDRERTRSRTAPADSEAPEDSPGPGPAAEHQSPGEPPSES